MSDTTGNGGFEYDSMEQQEKKASCSICDTPLCGAVEQKVKRAIVAKPNFVASSFFDFAERMSSS